MPAVCSDRSTASVVLFSLVVLGGVTSAAHQLGLPPVVGAFFAGLVLSGSRWTARIEAVVLPFREAFAAIFFASLGLLLQPAILWEMPLVVLGGFVLCFAIKMGAAALALRATDVSWAVSVRMGAGLAHIGEFAFVLALTGLVAGVIDASQYALMIAIGLATLVLTPPLFRLGVSAIPPLPDDEPAASQVDPAPDEAVVIGIGPVGQRLASTLEMRGVDVCVVDLSPVNLHAFAQVGFRTVAGDAGRPAILRAAGVAHAGLVIVCVPNDEAALEIVRRVRIINHSGRLIVRCRYESNAERLRKLGADEVISEEVRTVQALLSLLGAA
jgi:CPA2 family monovalent cation:H+ antiporter-2